MEDTGRKRKRYNTFRASSNPLPPKRSLRRHIRTILSAIPLCNESIKSPADANVEYLPLESQSSQNESFFQTADMEFFYPDKYPEELTFQYHGSTDCASTLEENFDVELSDERRSHEINETSFQHELQELVDQGETDSIINEADLEITGTVSNESETSKEDQDPPVYPSCPLWLSESVLLIMTLAIRHKLTGEALADVIKLIDLHCIPGTQNRSIKSLRELKSYFVNSKETDLFYYCN